MEITIKLTNEDAHQEDVPMTVVKKILDDIDRSFNNEPYKDKYEVGRNDGLDAAKKIIVKHIPEVEG